MFYINILGSKYNFLHIRLCLRSQHKEVIMLINDNGVVIKRLCLLKDLFKNYIPGSNYMISDEVLEVRWVCSSRTCHI